ncbi:MAG: hypothetical protein Kow00129_11330 [Thermoleophilia bacterium]
MVAAVFSFLLGFLVFWQVGSRVAGGEISLGLPDLSAGSEEAPTSLGGQEKYPVAVQVDMRRLRDRSYRPVKGIYLSSWVAGHSELLQNQLDLADSTEINAFVVDIKDATGYVTYAAEVPLADELGLEEERIKDIDALVSNLQAHGVVPIARLVVFKDPLLADKRPELAVQSSKGGVWRDRKGFAYLNPYQREVWDYTLDIAEDAVGRGFREIQFDYVRFPSDGPISEAVYPGQFGPKEDAIAAFLAYARQRLEPLGVWVSADVFGLTVYERDDMGIGQKIEKVAQNVDIVCPMIYPSHYYSGHYDIDEPNAKPYEIVRAATADATRRLDGTGAIYRPWLQDFSLGGVEYGAEEVRAQIRAVEEQGYTEWILWDPQVSYTRGALRSAG